MKAQILYSKNTSHEKTKNGPRELRHVRCTMVLICKHRVTDLFPIILIIYILNVTANVLSFFCPISLISDHPLQHACLRIKQLLFFPILPDWLIWWFNFNIVILCSNMPFFPRYSRYYDFFYKYKQFAWKQQIKFSLKCRIMLFILMLLFLYWN